MSIERDTDLQRKVEDALRGDPESTMYDINIDVEDGNVHLTGIVDTLADKERFHREAAAVPGIKHIEDEISISTDGDITDRGVEFEVAEEMHADPRIDMKNIGVKSVKGKVFLVGHSNDPEEIEAAKEAASRARGVKDIIPQVKSKKDDPSLEEIFHSQVNNDDEKDSPRL